MAYFTRTSHFILSGLAIVLLAVYWPALNGPFVFDDIINVPQTKLDQFSFKGLWAVAWNNNSGLFGRPIPVASFSLNYLFWGDSTTSFKLTNLFIHLVNAILVYKLSKNIFEHINKKIPERKFAGSHTLALFLAAVWALHPLQVSTVMYVVQRMTLLMTCFSLMSLLAYTSFRMKQINNAQSRWPLLALVPVFMVLACLSKENGALIPVYIVTLEFFLFRHSTDNTHSATVNKHPFIISILALAVISGVCTLMYAMSDTLLSGYDARDFSLAERLRTQASVIIYYLKLIFLPSLSDMTFYYDWFPVNRQLDLRTVLAICTTLLLAIAAFSLRRIAPIFSIGIVLFLASHLMESTFLPLELVFEHRNYIGMVGLLLPTIWYSAFFISLVKSIRVQIIASIALISFLSLSTLARSHEWSSSISLNSLALESRPESLRARTTLAVVLAKSGETGKALFQLQEAKKYDPNNAYPYLLEILVKLQNSPVDENEVASVVKLLSTEVISKDIAHALESIFQNRYHTTSKHLNTNQQLALFKAATTSKAYRIAPKNRAVLLALYSELLSESGQFKEAVSALESAILFNPTNVEISTRLVENQLASNQLLDARQQLSKLKILPLSSIASVLPRIEQIEETLRISETGLD